MYSACSNWQDDLATVMEISSKLNDFTLHFFKIVAFVMLFGGLGIFLDHLDYIFFSSHRVCTCTNDNKNKYICKYIELSDGTGYIQV